uniref:CRIB domain-containing protein n=1 Tax=Ditylenchus dipsaci TaxID=166011 RepID=A0A915EE06_9BILA
MRAHHSCRHCPPLPTAACTDEFGQQRNPQQSSAAKPQQQHKLNKESKKAKKGDKRPKHRKEDIANLTDFKTFAHVGSDKMEVSSRQVYTTTSGRQWLRDLLRAAGLQSQRVTAPLGGAKKPLEGKHKWM